MGACFQRARIYAETPSKAAEQARHIISRLRLEYGTGAYQGHLGGRGGFEYIKLPFASIEAAAEHAEANHGKWDEPWLMSTDDGQWLLAGWCSE
jgi:hypothetical protein